MNTTNHANHGHVSECLALLHEILQLWPAPAGTEPPDYRCRLRPMLANGFSEVDLLQRLLGPGEISATRESPGRVEIEFYDSERWLQKAVFVDVGNSAFKLLSLTFQCPVCFGTGENDGEVCGGCSGSGWGAT